MKITDHFHGISNDEVQEYSFIARAGLNGVGAFLRGGAQGGAAGVGSGSRARRVLSDPLWRSPTPTGKIQVLTAGGTGGMQFAPYSRRPVCMRLANVQTFLKSY